MAQDANNDSTRECDPSSHQESKRNSETHGIRLPMPLDLLVRFSSSGFFFMIVGGVLLYFAYDTIGTTHSAVSFVFIVAGVAILLFGTGTQGRGTFAAGADPTSAARYQVMLAGGAGVIAFCVAAGMIKFSDEIKQALLPTPNFIKLTIEGDSAFHNDFENYRYVASVDGNRVPAVQKEQFIEILAPYEPVAPSSTFHLSLRLQATSASNTLSPNVESEYTVVIKPDHTILINNTQGQFGFDKADFPRYAIPERLSTRPPDIIAGQVVQ